jgi:6-phosphogluconolactonase (cycloisomerase 2 family)
VLANQINEDGSLTYLKSMATCGKGASGIDSETNATAKMDGTFSQGALQVANNHIYVVNPGSRTVSVLFINDDSGSMKMELVQTVESGGDFPTSLAVSEKLNKLCLAKGSAKNNVRCFWH